MVTVVGVLALAGGLAAPSGAYQRPGGTERVSVATDGGEGYPSPLSTTTYTSSYPVNPSIDRTGRHVAFESWLTGLVPPPRDANQVIGWSDIFVRDRDTGRTELVSVNGKDELAFYGTATLCVDAMEAEAGICPLWGSFDPSISADGRRVAFSSNALNLVDDDSNNSTDIFVRDRRSKWTRRVSVSSDGDETPTDGGTGQYASGSPAMSGDGRFVAFVSGASNLVEGDTNGSCADCAGHDVFVHDLKTSRTERVSLASGGVEASGGSCGPSLSATGRFVGFYSSADDLVDDDTNGRWDYFVHDRRKGTTERVSVGSNGEQAEGSSSGITGWMCNRFDDGFISADGRFVTFTHDAPNLIPNDTVERFTCHGFANLDAFLHDRKTGRTERISVAGTGEQGDGQAFVVSLSDDGRYVGFYSTANDLTAGDTGTIHCNLAGTQGDSDTFIHDRKTGITEMASVDSKGNEAVMCEPPFGSLPGVPDLEVDHDDVPLGKPLGGGAYGGSLSADGRYVSFSTCAENLVEKDTNGVQDLFVRDRGRDLDAELGERRPSPEPPDSGICIGDTCLPPLGVAVSHDSTSDVDRLLNAQGANLYGASLAYRPQYGDLFATIELEHLPVVLPGVSPVFYGLRFGLEEREYDVRATSLLGGTFGLFDCTGGTSCTKVADLRGGYGTTGMRVVFSLPFEAIGLTEGMKLTDVRAYSGIGTFHTGARKVIDTARVK